MAPAWIIAEVGAGNMKPVPLPALRLAVWGIRPEGVLPKWQLSHLDEVGICESGPGPLAVGITTMPLTP